MSSEKYLTVGVDPDWNGSHTYAVVKGTQLVDVLTLKMESWPFVGAGKNVAAVVIEWPDGGNSFAPKRSINEDGINVDPVIDTVRWALLLANNLLSRGVPVHIPTRQKILASLGHKVGMKGKKDQWVRDRLTEMGYTTGKGSLLNDTHAWAAMAAALYDWELNPCLYQGGIR